tara:strand:+ start:860 stop:1291 length:432 start_codon:yes stop_codon:yes gene_type:complete
MADDRQIIYTSSINPQEGLQDENSNIHWIQDSDIKTALGGSGVVDITSNQAADWYKSSVNVDVTGVYPTANGDSDTILFFYVKNNSEGSGNILISFNKDGAGTYNIQVSAGEAFAAKLNSITGDKLHIKSSAGVLEVELIAAK